jgi:hypothetical protein
VQTRDLSAIEILDQDEKASAASPAITLTRRAAPKTFAVLLHLKKE